MHYYKRNLGDYAKKAGRLSMLQHGAYTVLLDTCYDREQFPTLEEAIDWAWASTEAEIEAVKFVLRKFFVLEGDRYVQKRVQEELEAFHAKAKTNARIAKEREEKKANRDESKTKRERNVHETPPEKQEWSPNQEPITNTSPSLRSGEGRASRLPADWTLPDPWREWALQERPDLDPALTAAKFADYWHAKAGQDGRKLDWLATWRNWVREEKAPRSISPPHSSAAKYAGAAAAIFDGATHV